MNKWLQQIWPWTEIYELKRLIVQLTVELAQERQQHSQIKEEHHALKGQLKIHQDENAVNQKHLRKMANIIAIKGGII